MGMAGMDACRSVERLKAIKMNDECVGVCTFDGGYCTGCGRSESEVFDGAMDEKRKYPAECGSESGCMQNVAG